MKKQFKLSIGQYIVLSTFSVVLIYLMISGVFYYNRFTQTTDSLVDFQSQEISKQIVLNYENYISQTLFTSNYIQKELDDEDVKTDKTSLTTLFNFTSQSQRDINSITLLDSDGFIIISSDDEVRTSSYKDSNWFYEALENEDIFYFSAPQIQTILLNNNTNVISVSKAIIYLEEGVEKDGVILIDLNSNIIIELSKTTNLGDKGHILLLNDQNNVIYTSKSECLDGTCQSITVSNQYILGDFETKIDDVNMKANINTLSQTRWKLITFMNIEEVTDSNRSTTIFLAIISVTSLLLTIIIATVLASRIRNPLNQLKVYMKKVEHGDFDNAINIHGQREIEEIANSFNEMVTKIQELMVEVVEEQNQKLKNELTALQHQINPHFLYNTLDSIVWLAENERNEDVVRTVIALARFFRISISKGRNIITVKEELQHIKNYLVIQKVRYVDKFSYTINVDKKLHSYPCMKLVLQPIVENAIYHGVSVEKGEIEISCFEKDNSLVFEVFNTGYGITDEEIENIYDTLKNKNVNKGIGMRNVYQRLKLYYGDKADIIIESVLDESTTVRLIIPIVEVE